MNRVEIVTEAPVVRNFCRVRISDYYAGGEFLIDNADMDASKAEGRASVLGLFCVNCDGDSTDILQAAVENGTEVRLDN